jgi:hypothetical protein
MKTFNLNNNIYIQINQNGWDHLRETVGYEYIKHCIENRKVEIDGVDWYRLQAHQVIDLFPMNFGRTPLYSLNIMIDESSLL